MRALKINVFVLVLMFTSLVSAAGNIKHDPNVKIVPYKENYFRKGPSYRKHIYNSFEQKQIYGGKYANRVPYYIPLFGRRMYPLGQFEKSWTILGKKNPVYPRMMAFGDLRLAAATNEDAVDRKSEINWRLNLDVDFGITATERIHLTARPLDRNGEFTGWVIGDNLDEDSKFLTDFNIDALFFEGDLQSILSGIFGSWVGIDLPFAVGIMPLFFHNGIWFNDQITGGAFTLPAMNSSTFNISNMDLTFFYAYDRVNTAIQQVDDQARIVGFNWFVEAMENYIELGAGFTDDRLNTNQDYTNIMLSWSRRFRDIASWSARTIVNFGQGNNTKTADGELYLLETSWMTKWPYTLIPYANFFYGHNTPQALATAASVLNNVGILFEGDGITNFQTLDNTANDTYGGAIGLEYLFNLDQQLVFEFATVQVAGGQNALDRNLSDDQYGYAIRYQIPFTNELIFRADAMYADQVGQKDLYGVRTEIRLKF